MTTTLMVGSTSLAYEIEGFGGVRSPIVEQTEFAFNKERHSEEIYLLIRISRLEVLFQMERKRWESAWKDDEAI